MNTGITSLAKLPEVTVVYPFAGMEMPFAIGLLGFFVCSSAGSSSWKPNITRPSSVTSPRARPNSSVSVLLCFAGRKRTAAGETGGQTKSCPGQPRDRQHHLLDLLIAAKLADARTAVASLSASCICQQSEPAD